MAYSILTACIIHHKMVTALTLGTYIVNYLTKIAAFSVKDKALKCDISCFTVFKVIKSYLELSSDINQREMLIFSIPY